MNPEVAKILRARSRVMNPISKVVIEHYWDQEKMCHIYFLYKDGVPIMNSGIRDHAMHVYNDADAVQKLYDTAVENKVEVDQDVLDWTNDRIRRLGAAFMPDQVQEQPQDPVQ